MSVCEQRESWLLARRRGLGGSDIAAVVGMSPFKKPIDIFVGKTEAVEFGEDIREFMAWGNLLEPVIRSEYARRANLDIVSGLDISTLFPGRSSQWGEQTIVKASTCDWMLGTPDGIMRNTDAGLEIKNASFRGEGWGSAGSDEIPDHYAIQCQWYMAVTGRPRWDVAVLFKGNTLETFRLDANGDLILELMRAGESFWYDNVEKGLPPAIDESESYGRYLARKYSLATGDVLRADDTITALANELRQACEEKRQAEERERFAKNQLGEVLAGFQKTKGDFGSINWVRPKEGTAVNWQNVALALNPPAELIAAHTSPVKNTPYIRPFWSKEK
jgi:predicted phage-related endonuclease